MSVAANQFLADNNFPGIRARMRLVTASQAGAYGLPIFSDGKVMAANVSRLLNGLSAAQKPLAIDIMTLDLKMPGLGGIGVLERAKQVDPDIEVLIITGYGSLDTAVQGLRLRAFDYIAKPFDTAQVHVSWAARSPGGLPSGA